MFLTKPQKFAQIAIGDLLLSTNCFKEVCSRNPLFFILKPTGEL